MSCNVDYFSRESDMSLNDIKISIYQSLLEKVMQEYPDEENTESSWDSMAGVAREIHFYKRQFNSTEEADKFFESMRRNNRYLCMAAKVFKPVESKKVDKLRARLENAQKRLAEYISKHHVKDYKSTLIGCQNCKSKINKQFVKDDDNCPLCGHSFYGETTLKKIESFNNTINKIKEEIKELKEKENKNEERPWYWYITTAYHT